MPNFTVRSIFGGIQSLCVVIVCEKAWWISEQRIMRVFRPQEQRKECRNKKFVLTFSLKYKMSDTKVMILQVLDLQFILHDIHA